MARRGGWRLRVLLALVVGGLVYMHGIHPSPAGTHSGVTPAVAESSGHHPDAGRPTGAGHEGRGHEGRGEKGGHFAALCVAVLVSVLAAAVVLWLARRRRPRPIRREPVPAEVSIRLAVASLALGVPRLRPPVLAVARC